MTILCQKIQMTHEFVTTGCINVHYNRGRSWCRRGFNRSCSCWSLAFKLSWTCSIFSSRINLFISAAKPRTFFSLLLLFRAEIFVVKELLDALSTWTYREEMKWINFMFHNILYFNTIPESEKEICWSAFNHNWTFENNQSIPILQIVHFIHNYNCPLQ